MALDVKKLILKHQSWTSNALCFIPQKEHLNSKVLAILTHGYTDHKGSILPWASRLMEIGIPTFLFDLPGHYLGSYNEVLQFDEFKNEAHHLFSNAFQMLQKALNEELNNSTIILGGHSLGGLLALKATDLTTFNNQKVIGIGVGIGLAPINGTHLFNTDFYKNTLLLREQMVCPALSPANVFPWIKEEKAHLSIKNKRLHLITGDDDLVVGKDGTERLLDLLKENNNQVTIEKPKRLPHHMPELAASYIKKFLQDEKII